MPRGIFFLIILLNFMLLILSCMHVMTLGKTGGITEVFVMPSFDQIGKLLSSDGSLSDCFGLWVSASADGRTIAIGALGESSGRGACYVFEWNGSTYTELAKLTASDGLAGDQLGRSVSISSDGSIIVAGAPYDDIGANNQQGSAYVFVKSGTWTNATENGKLTASDGIASDQLGTSVAISSDGSIIALGAYGASIGANPDQGCGYVYIKSGAWVNATENAKLIASDGADGDLMGYGSSISGDGNIIAVTSTYSTIGANSDQGAVYVFQKGSGWSGIINETAKLTASDGTSNDILGSSVSISTDGVTIISGARMANGTKGAVYLFKKGSGWSGLMNQTAKLTVSDGANGDHFGWSCSTSFDGKIVAAGAHDYNISQGAAYVFANPGTWSDATEDKKLTASDGLSGDCFAGYGCYVSADGKTIVTGAFSDDIGTTNDQGSVYIFK